VPIAPIAISTPLRDRMAHWPGDPEPRIVTVADVGGGDDCTLTTLAMSAHTGTHVDAPAHYLAGGATLDGMPLAALIGPALVVDAGEAPVVELAVLPRRRIRRGDRVLFRTRNSTSGEAFDHLASEYAWLAGDAARWLAARGVAAVGVDGLSVDPPASAEAHLALLGAGVWIIEGLRLGGVPAGRYHLVCLPLRLAGAEGAPARAVLYPRDRR
jgi:arylformamidase